LGMGTGTYATPCRRYFDSMGISGVEIDEKITALAHEYFALDPAIPVAAYDGRAFLSGTDRKYDVIMVDAYQDITIPFQMSTQEFFCSFKSHLNDNGVLVVNMNMISQRENGITAYLQDTIASVFDTVYTADVSGSTNRELFASQNPQIAQMLEQNLAAETDAKLAQMMRLVSIKLMPCDAGSRILTDDKAPVEVLGMQTIDDMIRSELAYYKKRFLSDGISGIING
ncbi:MAG: fused MFS/spermidine synthase, partial [Oscillospiraceae bacterium]|nr:fused MFS/spermidine synthase [Oscillospiraceae bacterium]